MLHVDELWWPYPELDTEIKFTLINPITNEDFITAGPENTYWLTKWMNEDSYATYQHDQGENQTPSSVVNYMLKLEIDGYSFTW